MKSQLLIITTLSFVATVVTYAQDRREKVLKDKPSVEAAGEWIYNDLPAAVAEGKKTGKPLLVVLRCVP